MRATQDEIVSNRIFEVRMIENMEWVCLDLQANLLGEVELSPQRRIDLKKRKAALTNIFLEICDSERRRKHRYEFQRLRGSSVEDRVDGPVAKQFVTKAAPHRRRQFISCKAGELMTHVEIRPNQI